MVGAPRRGEDGSCGESIVKNAREVGWRLKERVVRCQTTAFVVASCASDDGAAGAWLAWTESIDGTRGTGRTRGERCCRD